MTKAGIYKITNPVGAVYIGQSNNIPRRWSGHKHPRKFNNHISNSIKKYSYQKHMFEVIHQLPCDCERKYMDSIEQLYIDQYRSVGLVVMNMTEGGTGGRIFVHKGHSEETKRKIGAANKGKRPSDECLKKAAAVCRLRVMPEWHKEKIRNSVRPVFSDEKKAAISLIVKEGLAKKFASGWKRPPMSEETKRKISDKNKGGTGRLGYRHSDETKIKIGIANSKKQ